MAASPDARQQASELIAERFTRVMNATVSPYGALNDLSMAALFAALPMVLIVRQAAGGDLVTPTSALLLTLGLLPLLVAIVAGLMLRDGRDKVIDWMAPHPFPLENLNSLLAGISDEFEIHFQPDAPLPDREELQKLLEPISDDTLATHVDPDQRLAVVKIGVIDSTRLPLRSHHQRYVRFQRIVDEILVPLHRTSPVAAVRVV